MYIVITKGDYNYLPYKKKKKKNITKLSKNIFKIDIKTISGQLEMWKISVFIKQ